MANWPKRSRRLASRNSMPYFVTSNFEHSPPKRVGYFEASQRVIGPIPDLPAHKSSQTRSTLSPREVIHPRPVMTVRRFIEISRQKTVGSMQKGRIDASGQSRAFR